MSVSTTNLAPFAALAAKIREATLRVEERSRATHGRFNVFTTLLSPYDEERLHTRFLHALLDPGGLHDCGSLFLDLFFETLQELPPVGHDPDRPAITIPISLSPWEITREVRTAQGDLDLFLSSANAGIAIENKIFASEQPGQIARYNQLLSRNHPMEGNRCLLYLTRFGEPSTTHEGTCYLRISYREHVLIWLEKCLRATYAQIPINQALLQYRAVVRQVVELPTDPEIMEEAIKFVKENPDIFRYGETIQNASNEVRLRFLQDIYEGVSIGLAGIYTFKPLKEHPSLGREEETNFRLIPKDQENPLFSSGYHLTFEYWATAGRARYAYGRWLFGLDIGRNVTDADRPFFEMMKDYILQSGADESYKGPIDKAPAWPVGWWELIPDLTDEILASELTSPNLSRPERLRHEIESKILILSAAFTHAKNAFGPLRP